MPTLGENQHADGVEDFQSKGRELTLRYCNVLSSTRGGNMDK